MPREFPSEGLVELAGRVPRSDYDEFIGNFPLHGATSWFVRAAVRELNLLCRDNPTMVEMIREAIRKVASEANTRSST